MCVRVCFRLTSGRWYTWVWHRKYPYSRHSVLDKFALRVLNKNSIFPLKFLGRTSCTSLCCFYLAGYIAAPMFVLSSNLISLAFAFTTYIMMKNFYLNKATGNVCVCVCVYMIWLEIICAVTTERHRNEDITVNLNLQSKAIIPWANHTVDSQFPQL